MQQGEALLDQGDAAAALHRFQAAWSALPEPRQGHDLAIPLLGAIADCHFLLGQWDDCRRYVQRAFRSGADLGNSFLRLRLGQSLFELGQEREAANWMVPVFLVKGRAPFDGEDPKYLELFRSGLIPPAGGWPAGW